MPNAEIAPVLVLIVECDQAVIDNSTAILSQAGYAVQSATTAEHALAIALSQVPHLILLSVDLAQPARGYALAQQFKMMTATATVPIIFMGDDPAGVAASFAWGGVDYVRKPLCDREVTARVHHHLLRQQQQHYTAQQQIQRLQRFTGHSPLLSHLQQRLRQQAKLLQNQNIQLQQEIQERHQAEAALRTEQRRSERLLLNILPQAIANQLKQTEEPVAERFDQVTILFADIVDFTPLSGQLSPLELVNLLNRVFSDFDRLTELHRLEKIKTIGDAYMVAGGVPLAQPDHAVAIMEMAIAMRQTLREINRDLGQTLSLRIGINTGPVVAGVIGRRKFSYDLWGDAVNVASRMESQGLPGRIQVTEATYHLLRDRYTFEKWGRINVKGKGKMTTYLFASRAQSPVRTPPPLSPE